MNNIYINIKDVAEAKGLKSTRSLRLELNKTESKYISREVQVNGGTSYEILFSSLFNSKRSERVLFNPFAFAISFIFIYILFMAQTH